MNASKLTTFLVNTAAFVVIIAGMKVAAPIIVLFLLAVFIAIITTPLFIGLQRRGVPSWLALLVLVLILVLVTIAGVIVMGRSIKDFADSLPFYQEKLQTEAAVWIARLDTFNIKTPDSLISEWLTGKTAFAMFGNTLAALSTLISKAFLVLLITVFLLLEAALLPAKFRTMPDISPETRKRAEDIVDKFRHYMGIKTLLSLLTGTLVSLLLFAAGVNYPILLGTLAFVLNFVPNIGSIMAAIPAVLVTFVKFGGPRAGLVALGYIIINIGIGNLLEPKLMGRRLGLSPAIIIISLIFWGWVLGPVGMLLSVPLTMTFKIVFESIRETQGFALLMADGLADIRSATDRQNPDAGDAEPAGDKPPAKND